jgi:hypothetical protein
LIDSVSMTISFQVLIFLTEVPILPPSLRTDVDDWQFG